MKTVLSCGLGVDSTALALLCKKIKLMPDIVVFADTGGEKPPTYHFKQIFEQWLVDSDFPPLITVKATRTRNGQKVKSLEEHCIAGKKLPDIAYGKKGCSQDWKKQPITKYLKEHYPNETINYLISYNADEKRRVKISDNPKIVFTYPLIDYGWGREKCLTEIAKSSLPIPCKSACFFCPSSKKSEVLLLAKLYPDLMERAIAMEKLSRQTNQLIKGLGRHWAWSEIVESERNQLNIFPENTIFDCNCIEAGVSIEQYWRQFPELKAEYIGRSAR